MSYRKNLANSDNSVENPFNRSFNSQYKGLKITEFKPLSSLKGSRDTYLDAAQTSKTIKYIKLLQNHKMDEKIEIEEDRIMSIFFKKNKEVSQTLKVKL